MRGFFRFFLVILCIPIAGILIGLSAFLLQQYYAVQNKNTSDTLSRVTPTPLPTPTPIPYEVDEIGEELLLQQSSMSEAIQFLDTVSGDIHTYSQKNDTVTLTGLSLSAAKARVSTLIETQGEDLEEIESTISNDDNVSREDKQKTVEKIKEYVNILSTTNRVVDLSKTVQEVEKLSNGIEEIQLYSFGIPQILYMYEFAHIQNRLTTLSKVIGRIEKTIEIEKEEDNIETIEAQYDDVMIRIESLEVALKKNYDEVSTLSVDDSYSPVFIRIRADNKVISEELSALRLDVSRLRILFEKF